jgi:hypothetical protein
MKKKYKKKVLINGNSYSTNDAKKMLSDFLKKEKLDSNKRYKTINLLSKRENLKLNFVFNGDLYSFEIVLFNYQNENRCNEYGESIVKKRNGLVSKIQKADTLLKEIFANKKTIYQLINNSANRLKIGVFDCSIEDYSIFKKSLYPMWFGDRNFKFKIDKDNRFIELHIFEGNIYRVDIPIFTKNIKELNEIIYNLEQIKDYLDRI